MRRRLAAAFLAAAMVCVPAAAHAAPVAPTPAPSEPPVENPIEDFFQPLPDGGGWIGGAIDGACKNPPEPVRPDRGIAGSITPKPSPVPGTADPFTDGATTTIAEQYGVAAFQWHTYGLECEGWGLGVLDPTAGGATTAANWVSGISEGGVAVLWGLADAVYAPDGWLTALDPAVTSVSTALYDGAFAPFAAFAALLLLVTLLIVAHRARLSRAFTSLLMVTAAITCAAAAANFPVAAGRTADGLISETLTGLNSAVVGVNREASTTPGVSAVDPIISRHMWRQWLMGTFGCADCAVAVEYGPRLFKASALTWDEAARVDADPTGYGVDVVETKRGEWETAVTEIEERHPGALSAVRGGNSSDRVGAALFALAGLIPIALFLGSSLLLIVGAYLIIRVVVMFAPLWALVAIVSHGVLPQVGRVVVAAVVNAVLFGAAVSASTLVFGTILSSAMPWWLALVVTGVIAFVMWKMLTPLRRLTALATGKKFADGMTDGASQAKDKAKATAGRYIGAVAGSATGNFLAHKAANRGKTQRGESVPYDRPERPYSTGAQAPVRVAPPEHQPVTEGQRALPAAPMKALGQAEEPAVTTSHEDVAYETVTPPDPARRKPPGYRYDHGPRDARADARADARGLPAGRVQPPVPVYEANAIIQKDGTRLYATGDTDGNRPVYMPAADAEDGASDGRTTGA